MEAGQEGAIRAQGIWMPEERRETIAWREFRALPLKLERLETEGLAGPAEEEELARARKLSVFGRGRCVMRCWVDTAAVVYIVRSMCTVSESLMRELRILQRNSRVLA
jgi:hypothetical protein